MRLSGLIVMLFCFTNIFAQNKTLDDVKKLVDAKQYESAIHLLDAIDPENIDPDIVIAKSEIFLKYFVSSIMHQLFAVKDLEEHEELMEIRGSDGSFSLFYFQADSILSGLIANHPNHYNLYHALGYYYHEVHLRYTGNWLLSDSEIVNRFTENYKIAHDNGVYDYWSLYGIAYSYLRTEAYLEAIPFLEKSIELNDSHAASFYNLAYTYMYLDEREKAIRNAKKALDLYEHPEFKADAARMIGILYEELENAEKALEFHKLSNEIEPENYYTLKSLLFLEIHLDDPIYKNRTHEFFLLAPDNPTIYLNLLEVYWQNDKQNELTDFLESKLNVYEEDFLISGNLHFYLANHFISLEEQSKVKEHLVKSRKFFAKVFEKEHPVFEIIDKFINENE